MPQPRAQSSLSATAGTPCAAVSSVASSHGPPAWVRPKKDTQKATQTCSQIVDPFSRGGFPGSSSSHSPAGDEECADEPGKGVFRTFPQRKKSATRPPHSGSALPPHSSPWTPPAYNVSMGRVEEQAKRWQETQQQASESLERARLLLDQASKRRKRKKRRKKKLPKASTSRSSCASHTARTRISGHSSTRP